MKLLVHTMLAVLSSAIVYQAPPLLSGWQQSKVLGGQLGVGEQVAFTVAVQETNQDEIKRIVDRVSDPKSSDYGQYLSSSEVLELTQPNKEDMDVVLQWLHQIQGVSYQVTNGRNVRVTASVKAAETLLQTTFRSLYSEKTQQRLLRASDYTIPDKVNEAIGAIFGLHGMPLPPKSPLGASLPHPAAVTPAVLASTYSVSGVTPSGSDSNRMAVAEFEGEYEKDSDLAAFFKEFVPKAAPGDDKVSKFVGTPDRQMAGVEASLDIQYMMGVAPHVKAEFWLFAGQDFCLDLQSWTTTMLADNAAPLVHSVSYGWQGDLTRIGCKEPEVSVIDSNFAKLAAKGITIIFASGDSGSGYDPHRAQCQTKEDVAFQGTEAHTIETPNAPLCCDFAGQMAGSAGFNWVPAGGVNPGATCTPSDHGTADTVYVGGTIVRNITVNGPDYICCEIAENEGPYFSSTPISATESHCVIYREKPPSTKPSKGSYAGQARKQSMGNCTIFSKTSGAAPTKGTISSAVPPLPAPVMWASWPASSPYVTSVGATRFVDQKVGQPEMATDQFGSGGGFSGMFKRATLAKWQDDAVNHYVNNPPKDPHYPPTGSFDPNGRATPDVCALGEGYQVVWNGKVAPVGGTSASTPAFAGMVALLNEARAQKGKAAMGFLNPFLYQNVDCFTDVTLGTNAIGRGNGPILYGFNATQGWDPATGLGSPKFDKLLAAATA